MFFAVIPSQVLVPEIGPAILTVETICRKLSNEDRKVTCTQSLAGRLLVIHLAAGPVNRDLTVLGSALGVSYTQKGKIVEMSPDRAVEIRKDKLLSAEAAVAWDPYCRMSQDSLAIIRQANEPFEKLQSELIEKTGEDEVNQVTNATELAQTLCGNAAYLPSILWLSNLPSLESGVRDEGRNIVFAQQLMDDPSLFARELLKMFDLSHLKIPGANLFSPEMLLLGFMDQEVRFDPVSEQMVLSIGGSYGCQGGYRISFQGAPFSLAYPPKLPDLYRDANLDWDAIPKQTKEVLDSDSATAPVPIGWAPTWSAALLHWVTGSGAELVAPVSAVRDDLVAWPPEIDRLSLKVILQGPLASQSAATTWDRGIEDRGATWAVRRLDGVLVVGNNRGYLDDARWVTDLPLGLEETILDPTARSLADWMAVAKHVNVSTVAQLAKTPTFQLDTGFCAFFPVLEFLNSLDPDQLKRVMDARDKLEIAIPYRDNPAGFAKFESDAPAIAPAIDHPTGDNGMHGLTSVLQSDFDQAVKSGAFVFRWEKGSGEWSLWATLFVADMTTPNPDFLSAKPGGAIWTCRLDHLVRR